ncbi:MAG: HAMP domain-containing histidine kinase [Lachnospiraceae bacterium]|nr:HAMP domain-containing histidine kinase [Lachnospiraceae bacterium]
MADRTIERIRKILIKTVLPLRKKKEEFFSKLRFSIQFRIALNYMKLFIINSVIIVLLFILTFITVCSVNHEKEIDEIVAGMEKGEITKEEYHRVYENTDIKMRVEDTAGNVIYDDIDYKAYNSVNILGKAYCERTDGKVRFIMFEDRQINAKKEYFIHFQMDYSKEIDVFVEVLGIMMIIILFLTVYMVYCGRTQTKRILKPIDDMSMAAQRLTANNLSSQRLNVEGTKNELKDLAGTINTMLDRLELSYESQKQFVSDASHELRTPIAVIQGYINMLDRWGKEDKEVMEESVEAIKNESQAMKELVEKLLFLSRHDKKTLKLNKEKFDVAEMITDTLKETQMVAKDRNVDTYGIDSCYIYGDKQSIKQAVRVFVDNAVKYSKEGDSIIISCESKNGKCYISIKDTGIGMKRKDIDNIFKRFYRADDVRKKNISGHGLGLSIAKLIILKHTGSITINSQYGTGTTFTIMLPVLQYKK